MSEEARLSIHRYFQEFGFEVGEAVYLELRKPGGMPKLLKKLGIPVEGDTDGQFKMLLQYFRRMGTATFLELAGTKPVSYKIDVVAQPERDDDTARARLGLNPIRNGRVLSDDETAELRRRGVLKSPPGIKPATTPPPPATRGTQPDPGTKTPMPTGGHPPNPVSNDQLHLRSRDKVQKPVMYTVAPPAAQSPNRTPVPADPPSGFARTSGGYPLPAPMGAPPRPPAALPGRPNPYDKVDDEGFPKGPLIPAPSPDPSLVTPDSPAHDPSKPFDPTGTWPEVERRSGRERRHKPDRRDSVDMVFKNKRFGKDRRSKKERRRNWPPGGFVK